MSSSLAIGDFSRATHLNIKTLRHYHRIGLIEPAHVDPGTGHRRYGTNQIPTAQVIRRFRGLDMPLEEIQAVIATTDLAARNELIAGHLEPPIDATPVAIEHRRLLATPVAAVSEVIDGKEATAWYQGALGELYALLAAQKISPTGPGGAIYANDLFTHERGEATVFVPCDQPVRPTGRVTAVVVPEVELALTVHVGPHSGEIDRAYGSLATYVTEHALAVEGPIREYYVIGPHETSDENQWRTEIGWPIFHTGHPENSSAG
jgi:DNA-binding transcriptional MerR regulator